MKDHAEIARRSAPRHELERVLPGHIEYSAPILVVDLSTSGALVEHHRYLKPGSQVTLALPLGGECHKVLCSVVHCSVHEIHPAPGRTERATFRVGVKFEDLAPAARGIIRDLIKERLANERREQPRLYLGRPAHVEESVELRAVNISTKGGLFSARQPLEPGSEHDLLFRLPSGEVKARGIVRHCQMWAHSDSEARFQVGVEFLRCEGKGADRIQEYMDAQGDDSSSADP